MSSPFEKGETRRQFLKIVGSGAVVVPLAGLTACSGGDSDQPQAPAATPPPAASSAPPASAAPEPVPAPAPDVAGLPILAEDDPTAVALGYKHAAADVDTEKYPARAEPQKANAICGNCVLYQGAEGAEWGLCTIFPGKRVNTAGWCASYAPKA